MITAKEILDNHEVCFVYEEPECTGMLSITVLQQLNGLPWNDNALCYITALIPAFIRVVKDGQSVKNDYKGHRITVSLDADNNIASISMEATVYLRDNHEHGQDLEDQLFGRQESSK